jgi:hypothetical protein
LLAALAGETSLAAVARRAGLALQPLLAALAGETSLAAIARRAEIAALALRARRAVGAVLHGGKPDRDLGAQLGDDLLRLRLDQRALARPLPPLLVEDRAEGLAERLK